ncbi:MAG: hypothetical protein MR965_07920 [Lachnospiraceae bacterium]|nr:hypothetical protein [Lachnospiraceae bacterium]
MQVVSGNTKTYSEPVSATVNKKLITPVVQIKGTKTTYAITVKKSRRNEISVSAEDERI